VTGAFSAGETITAGAASATSSGGQTGETTLTLDVATPGATDHGFAASNLVWVRGSGSYSTGLFSVTARAATTITYTEGTTSAATAASIGTVSYDSAGEATLSGSTAAANDVAKVGTASSLPAGYQGAVRAASLGAQYWAGPAETSNSTGTVVAWYALNAATALSFYPIDSANNQAQQIASAVNALAAASAQCPVAAVAVGSGGVATGQISKASFDDFSAAGYAYQLTDGINWISSNTSPPDVGTNYSFTFKAGITSALATNSDWANEEVRIVPGKAQNLADHLNVQAVSGLSSAAEVAVASGGGAVQISSLAAGSAGSVQVQGGAGNSLSAAVVGSGQDVSATYLMAACRTSDVAGLTANMWVRLQNGVALPKPVFTSASSLSSLDASGNFVLTGTQAWTYANAAAAAVNGFAWQVEVVGKFVAFKFQGVGAAPSLAGVQEGDVVVVTSGTISARNAGTFRIVRISDAKGIFWVENQNAADELGTANLWFLKYDSILPGDQIQISTPIWGAGNQGAWTVSSISIAAGAFAFQVSTSAKATSPFTGPQVLGSSSPLVQCFEGSPRG
jgi:hypothetical protein